MFGGSSAFGAPSSGGMFGGSGFGAPATSLFGAQQQQQQQPPQPQVPAQAALQAHMEAINAAETQKIKAELSKLYAIYTGEVTPSTPSDAKKNFVSIVYNDMTQEQRQLQWLHGMGSSGNVMPMAPPKPPQVSEEDWYKAVVHNPDPMNYMPVALVGADALSARLAWQQERASQLAKDAATIQNSHETAKALYEQAYRRIEQLQRDHANNRRRLLIIMRKVEVVRCMNLPLQPAEVVALGQLRDMSLKVQEVKRQIDHLQTQARKPRQIPEEYLKEFTIHDPARLSKMFTEHAQELKKLNAILAKDVRDVELIKQSVMPKE
jgi:Nucleoporin complex subunit 54